MMSDYSSKVVEEPIQLDDSIDILPKVNSISATEMSDTNIVSAGISEFSKSDASEVLPVADDNNNPNNQPEVNCLALTLKKDYSLSIFKNRIKKAVKGSWKIAVSIFVLNFLSSFF